MSADDGERGSIEDGSAGPRLGFQEAFSAAWAATNKAHSFLAVEQGLRAVEQEQIKRLRAAGLRPPDSLDDSETVGTGPFGGAQFHQGRYSAAAQSIVDGGGWYTDEMISARDDHLKKLQAERPDLGVLTYADMFKKVQADAQEAEKRSELPKTLAGHVGAFAGEALASMNPVSNPVNAAAMFVGGGSGALGRAAVQGVAQGAAESVNLALAQPENLLLGRDRQPGEDVARIGMAMVGGAGVDLLFSGAGAAIRRARTGKWFADQPLPEPEKPPETLRPTYQPEPIITGERAYQGEHEPPIPAGRPLHEYPTGESFARAHDADLETNVYGRSREAALRVAMDLDHVRSELNRWDGPAPWEVKPPEPATFVPGTIEPTVAFPHAPEPGVEINIQPGGYTRYLDNMETVDDIARRVDPDTFRKFDVLKQRVEDIRKWIDNDKKTQTFFDADEIERQEREKLYRSIIQENGQEMRDLAPLVSRAYALAEREWRSTPMDHNALEFFRSIEERAHWRYRGEGKPSLTEEPPRVRPADQPPVSPTTVDDAVPLASMEPGIDNRLHVDTDTAAARVKQNAEHTREKLDETVEQFTRRAQEAAAMTEREAAAQAKALEEKLARLREERSAAARDGKSADVSEAINMTEKELDALQYVTFPDGRKLHLDNDRAPLVHDDGRVEEVSIRDFMREMAKDQEALSSVTTCSRPS